MDVCRAGPFFRSSTLRLGTFDCGRSVQEEGKMQTRLMTILLLALLASVPGSLAAQRSRRPTRGEDTGPVNVTRSATLRVSIASDATGIFDYLSDSQKLILWFPNQAIMEPQLGGQYHFRWEGTEGVWSGVVTEFIRGNTLGYTWRAPNDPYPTNVRFKLSPQGAETTVELTHGGFTSSDMLDKAVKAWVLYLRNLKSVVEGGTDMREAARRPATRPRRR
jgi:uncharacterized protein YndB with AHSA1/START domain